MTPKFSRDVPQHLDSPQIAYRWKGITVAKSKRRK